MSDVQPVTEGVTHRLDYALAETIEADSAARLKALGNPLRMLILDLVLEKAMTVTELAERVVRPRGTVAHHVDLLVDVGLLQVVRTRKVRAVEERFYGRAARTIVFPDHAHDGDLPFFVEARAVVDTDPPDGTPGGFSMRSVRIPDELAAAFVDRMQALAVEFSALPRGGTWEYAFLFGVFPTNRPVAPKGGADGQ